ncbi:MAG: hypothetical protein RQ741_02335 [Wenzhouxiangellaceae bacterium]|nr:hypothetical protein [Wenzhouxiangellaceae bacterium]
MRPWWFTVWSAVVIAGLVSALASHEPFEGRLVRLETERALPSLASWLQQESTEINAIFLDYARNPALWMSGSLAILRHGDVARDVLLEYGLLPQFQDVLVSFGADAVLPVSYFRSHDVATLRAQHWLGERYQQLGRWWSEEVDVTPSELTPYRRGLMGIALLDDHGHALLKQFVVSDQGRPQWLQGERVVAGVGGFFTSGLRDLESRWRRGDDIGAGDLGWAGLDLAVMAGAVKVLRAGKAARSVRPASVGAPGASASGRGFAKLSRTAKITTLAGAAYVVVRHPSLVSALGANLSRWLGWPVWMGQFLIWLIVLLPLLIMARLAYRWLLAPLLWLLVPVLRRCLKAPDQALTTASDKKILPTAQQKEVLTGG